MLSIPPMLIHAQVLLDAKAAEHAMLWDVNLSVSIAEDDSSGHTSLK